MRVLELFGGYGSQALALENLGLDFTSDLCEIDKYAIMAYNQLHGETKNWGDICKIDETQLPYYDLITYSSPCQDFSFAGKGAGGERGSGTRSSLLWECERIINAVKPKYLLMENVKALTGKKFMPLFQEWLRTLEKMGYKNWWKVLNAKDYGVPQNRERVFFVSILGGGHYQFPEPIPLTIRLKDILEQNVEEKYYLSEKLIQGFLHRQEVNPNGFARHGINIRNKNEYASTLMATMAKWRMTDNYIEEPVACASRGRNPEKPSDRTTGAPTEQRLEINQNGTTNTITTVAKDNYILEPKLKQVGKLDIAGNDCIKRVYDSEGISPTLTTMEGGNRQPKIIDDIYPSRTPREYENYSPTLRTHHSGDLKVDNGYRIRKLTPRECWRLMGVRDEQFDKLHDISNCQLYKMAGNSIVVDVLMGIFKNMFMPDEQEQKGQLELL